MNNLYKGLLLSMSNSSKVNRRLQMYRSGKQQLWKVNFDKLFVQIWKQETACQMTLMINTVVRQN